jgi:hypothetical protein
MKNLEIIDHIIEAENLCYNGKNEEALFKINTVIEEIASGNMQESIVTVLNLLVSAVEKKDFVLAADYMEYGVKPYLLGEEIPDTIIYGDLINIPFVSDEVFYLSTCTDELAICINNTTEVIRMNSAVSPEHEAKTVFENMNLKDNTPIVCLFGIGTGILADLILNNLSTDAKLIIFEPDRKILDFINGSVGRTDSTQAETKIAERIKSISDNKNTTIFVGISMDEFKKYLSKSVDYRGLSGLVFEINSGYRHAFSDICLEFIRAIDFFRKDTLININTVNRFKDEYLEVLFRNLNVCRRVNLAYELAKVIPQSVPVIIVSAGPSLNKNIEVLKQAKGRMIIIAVDTALRFLLEKDIVPDLTISIDPVKPAEYYADDRAKEIPCVIDICANPEIVKKQKGRIFLMASNQYLTDLFDLVKKPYKKNQPGGGSVATVAFALLYDLGIKTIILVGQDLASENGKTHAGTINEGELGELSVEGIYGGTVRTRPDWYAYLKWFETAIKSLNEANENIRVIDATEGGALIHGAEIMTLKEAINECVDEKDISQEIDFGKEIEKLPYFFNESEYENICACHKKNVTKLKLLKNDAESVVRICKQLKNDIEKGKVSDLCINKQKKTIQKIHERYLSSIWHFMINQYLSGTIIGTVSSLSLKEGDSLEKELNGIELIEISFEKIIYVIRRLIDNTEKYMFLLEKKS